MKCKF